MIELLKDPEIFTSVLMVILIDRYGIEVLTWDLETILMELQDDFRVTLPPSTIDKIAVGQLLLTTNMFHVSLPDFINFCNVMCNESGLKESWSPADSYEMAWAVAEEELLVHDGDQFSPDILAYMKTILRDEGIVRPPTSMTFISTDDLNINGVSQLEDPLMFQASYEQGVADSENVQAYLDKQLDVWKSQMQRLQLKKGNLQNLFPDSKL